MLFEVRYPKNFLYYLVGRLSNPQSWTQVALSYDYQVTRPSDDEDTQSSFAKLLNTIVRVNEERMDAVRKITQLQDYMFTKNKLKADDDAYDSLEEEDNRVLWAFDVSIVCWPWPFSW